MSLEKQLNKQNKLDLMEYNSMEQMVTLLINF